MLLMQGILRKAGDRQPRSDVPLLAASFVVTQKTRRVMIFVILAYCCAKQERNKRALELLLQKDSTIRQLQERCRLAEEQLSEQQCSLAAAEGKARAAVALQQQLEDKLKLLQQQHKQELVRVSGSASLDLPCLTGNKQHVSDTCKIALQCLSVLLRYVRLMSDRILQYTALSAAG